MHPCINFKPSVFPTSSDALVKRLLPLGFTRASIRKELYLSNGNPDAAALRLLEQQEERERESEEQFLGEEGGAEKEGGEGGGREGKKNEKSFTIGNIEVCVYCMINSL